MPRTKHNTVDEIFYPRSFGARNVVQDRSKGCVSITDYLHIIHFYLFCAGLCKYHRKTD